MHLVALITAGLVLAPAAIAQEKGVLLQDQETGLALTLPAEWSFATSPQGLLGTNGDKSAMVLLAASEDKFETVAFNLENALQKRALSSVELDRAVIVLDRNRGELDGLVTAEGAGINQKGERVSFSTLVVKEGEAVGLIIGAWKNAAQGDVVKEILEGIHHRQPSLAGGVELTDTATGASIQIPEGWVTLASKAGLLAYSPDRGGMAVIMRDQPNFAKAVKNLRTILKARVFEDVEIGEFAAASAIDAVARTELARAAEASGKAVDRVDKKEVSFRVMALQRTEEDRGTLVLGAWKSPKYQSEIATMLSSIKVSRAKKLK